MAAFLQHFGNRNAKPQRENIYTILEESSGSIFSFVLSGQDCAISAPRSGLALTADSLETGTWGQEFERPTNQWARPPIPLFKHNNVFYRA